MLGNGDESLMFCGNVALRMIGNRLEAFWASPTFLPEQPVIFLREENFGTCYVQPGTVYATRLYHHFAAHRGNSIWRFFY